MNIGADPEFFLVGQNENGALIIPSVGVVPGTKEEPYQLGNGFFTHEDNVVVELGIPVISGECLGDVVMQGKSLIINEFLSKKKYSLSCGSSVRFTTTELESDQAQRFGCEPDFDAYTAGEVREIPDSITNSRYRSAGGHIHLGGNFNCPPFVVALFCDLYLGVQPWLDGYAQLGMGYTNRLQWYGKPGIFRPKPYGIEYRSPSNWWCETCDAGNYIGSMAMRVAQYLETASGTTIRTSMKKIPWIAVQDFFVAMSQRRSPQSKLATKAGTLMAQVADAGVTL